MLFDLAETINDFAWFVAFTLFLFYVPFIVSILLQLPFYMVDLIDLSLMLHFASYIGFIAVIVGYIDYLRR